MIPKKSVRIFYAFIENDLVFHNQHFFYLWFKYSTSNKTMKGLFQKIKINPKPITKNVLSNNSLRYVQERTWFSGILCMSKKVHALVVFFTCQRKVNPYCLNNKVQNHTGGKYCLNTFFTVLYVVINWPNFIKWHVTSLHYTRP